MVFSKCSIGTKWIFNENEQGKICELLEGYTNQDVEMNKIMEEEQYFMATATFLLLSLCHTVTPRERLIEKKTAIFFEGESVDEVALVEGASRNGFNVKSSNNRITILTVNGKDYEFARLVDIPFTPERKRMTTVFNIPPNFLHDFPVFRKVILGMHEFNCEEGVSICLAKGADSFLFPCINFENVSHRQEIEEAILKFATEGLRTLLLAFKFLEKTYLENWIVGYEVAKASLGQDRVENLERLEKKMEQDLIVLGATAIEDKLQDEVPQTIKFFLDSGLQVFLLTGDKRETAVNVANMASLIGCNTTVFTLDGDNGSIADALTCNTLIEKYISMIKGFTKEQSKDVALVIDGHAFVHCLEKTCQKIFVELLRNCKTVICCRATPKQKAELVELVEKKFKKRGLAIGDGANDGMLMYL